MAPPGKPDIKVTASDALEFEPMIHEPPKRRWGLRIFMILVVVAAGAGAWHYYGDELRRLWGGAEAGIPLIRAASTPVKVRPENPGGLEVPDRDKLVYDRIQGTSEGRGPERLLPPPEQPLPRPAPAEAAPPPKPPAPEKSGTAATQAPTPTPVPLKPVAKVPTAADVAAAERPAPPPPPPAPPIASKPSPLAMASPKRVAKPEAAPAEEPKSASTAPAPEKVPEKLAVPEPSPPPPQPTSPPRPAAVAAATPAPPPLAAAPAVPAGPSFLVQLAAARSQEGAEAEWEKLRSRNQDLLGNLRLTVTRADLGQARGVFYRLRAGPIADEAKARELCSQLTKRQVGCLVIKPGQ